jgi:hypothetical protein
MRLDFRKANLARESLGMSITEGWWSLFYLVFPVLPSVLLAHNRKLPCTQCQAIDALHALFVDASCEKNVGKHLPCRMAQRE